MVEKFFYNKIQCIGLLFVYFVLLRDSCNISQDIFNFLNIPFNLEISFGMELGPTVAVILSFIWLCGCCVILYVLAHIIGDWLY